MQTIAKKCVRCNKEFNCTSKSPKRRFCSRECANAWHGESMKTLKEKPCKYCGKIFKPRNHKIKYCCKECGNLGRQIWCTCKICGGKYRSYKGGKQKYCSRECYYKSGTHRFYIPGQRESKDNRRFRKLLCSLGLNVEKEIHLGNYYYDFKVGNILIELNPYPFHNCTRSPVGKIKITKYYHYNKYKYAIDNGYRCIMVWDWTTNLIDMLTNSQFHYEGQPQLHYYNPTTKEHIIRKNRNKSRVDKGFVEIRDCGKEVF